MFNVRRLTTWLVAASVVWCAMGPQAEARLRGGRLLGKAKAIAVRVVRLPLRVVSKATGIHGEREHGRSLRCSEGACAR